EIVSAWPGRPIRFEPKEDQESEAFHWRNNDGSATIYVRSDADDEAIFHELIHNLHWKQGTPLTSRFTNAVGAYDEFRAEIETRVSHPYVYREMSRRGFDSSAYWKRMKSAILSWDQPDMPPGLSLFKNAAVMAESVVCSTEDVEAIASHAAS